MDSIVTRRKPATRTGSGPETAELAELVLKLQRSLAQVLHDVNNPLAIISGNAQLLGELAGDGGADGEMVKCISDLEEATERLGASLRLLSAVSDEAEAALSEMPNALTPE